MIKEIDFCFTNQFNDIVFVRNILSNLFQIFHNSILLRHSPRMFEDLDSHTQLPILAQPKLLSKKGEIINKKLQ